MSKKKWFLLAAAVIGVGLMGVALMLVVVFGLLAGHGETTGIHSVLPVYTSAQTASSHAGYRHSTLTCGEDVFVNDYEEAGLRLTDPEPQTVVGYRGFIGGGKVCSIPGQPITAYVACDCGSEMPAYVPYRNIKQKPFDWRSVTFSEMTVYRPRQGSSRPTANGALLAEVVRTLRDGVPVELPSFAFASIPDLASIQMTSDQLPGLQFCPIVFTDANGQVYLAESLMFDTTSTPIQLHARWIPVGPTLTHWLKTP